MADSRILVVGATGVVGRPVVASLRGRGVSVLESSRGSQGGLSIDLCDPRSYADLPTGLDAAVICCGVGSLAECRKDPAGTAAVNVDGTVGLVRELLRRDVFVVVLSSSYVFDASRPDFSVGDPVTPACEYGRQKADLEKRILDSGNSVAVVRMTKVLDGDNGLLRHWASELRGRRRVLVANDARLAPLPPDFAAGALARLVAMRAEGLWQLSAIDDISWFEIARSLARAARMPAELVEGCPLVQIDSEAEFTPRHGGIDCVWPFELMAPPSLLAVDRAIESICACK